VAVTDDTGRRVRMSALLGIQASGSPADAELAVGRLREIIKATEVKNIGAVKVAVTTRWPAASLAIAERVLNGVNRFNVETRKTQAAAERQFVEVQAADAERALRAAEDRLQFFLQGNRAISNSPELAFQRDRLARQVSLREQVYSSLLKNEEEARIREVRNTPVITVIESPRLPVISGSRGVVTKTGVGAILGGMLGILLVFLAEALARAKRAPNEKTRELADSMSAAMPRFVRLWI
jgi:VIT1/CCC1 family predicted Fe2+/Mn2+ transporter